MIQCDENDYPKNYKNNQSVSSTEKSVKTRDNKGSDFKTSTSLITTANSSLPFCHQDYLQCTGNNCFYYLKILYFSNSADL